MLKDGEVWGVAKSFDTSVLWFRECLYNINNFITKQVFDLSCSSFGIVTHHFRYTPSNLYKHQILTRMEIDSANNDDFVLSDELLITFCDVSD